MSIQARLYLDLGDYCILHRIWISQKRFHAGIIVAPQQSYSVGEKVRPLWRLIGL